MVQIIQMPQKVSPMERFTEGLAQGFTEQRAEQREEKKMGLEYQYKTMLEDRKEKKNDYYIMQAAESIARAKKVPNSVGAIAAMIKLHPEAAIQMINNNTPEDWASMDEQVVQHAAGAHEQNNQTGQTGKVGTGNNQQSNITSGNINPQTNATNATNAQNPQNQLTAAPVNPMVLQDRNNQMNQLGANMMPSGPIPVNRQANNGQTPQNNAPMTNAPMMNDEDRFVTIGGVKRVKSLDLAQNDAERQTFWERTSKTPAEARAKAHAWNEQEKLKTNKYYKEDEKQRADRKERREVDAKPLEYIKDLNNRWKKAKEKQVDLKSIEELAKKYNKDNVSTFKNRFITLAGGDPSLWTNPSEDLIQKLASNLTSGVVSEYGSMAKIFKVEAESFVKTLPTLVQNQEGQIKVAKYMYAKSELLDAEHEAMKEVKEEYKGKGLPEDFQELVEERAEAKQDAIREKMHQIMVPGAPPLASMKDKVIVKDPTGKSYAIPVEKLSEALSNPTLKFTMVE